MGNGNPDSVLAEALARIEHKLDFVLIYIGRLMGPNFVSALGDMSHPCPVCKQQVKYVIDQIHQVLVRKCGCKTGKLAPIPLEAFAPPQVAGGKNVPGTGSEEDGSDSDAGRHGAQGSRGSRRR